MADFPALKPDARRYSMGTYPVTTEGESGTTVRFLHGIVSSSHALELSFLGLSETKAALIRDHYRLQNGGYLPFDLSTQVWAGHSSMTDLVPSTTKWKYAKPPEESHNPRGIIDVKVSLLSTI